MTFRSPVAAIPFDPAVHGAVAERLGRGLQSPLLRFESGRHLFSNLAADEGGPQ